MSALATAAAAWLLTYALHSTVLLAAAALLAARVLRTEAGRETVWKAALVGGILTATLQTALGYQPLVGRWSLAAPAPAVVASADETEQARRQVIALKDEKLAAETDLAAPVTNQTASQAVDPAAPATATQPEAAPADVRSGPGLPRLPWQPVLLGAWLLGAALLLVRLAVRQLRLHGILRDRRPVTDGPLPGLVAELRRGAGFWTPVRLTSSHACSTPLALGSAEVCVPERFLTALDPDQQRAALAHELGHLARRDPWWHLAAGLIESVFFFQPLNRLARRRLREAAEYLADDWAVRQTGSALGLARCLAEVASWVVAGGRDPVLSGTLAMAEGGSPLVRRVERLLAGRGEGAGNRIRQMAGAALLLAAVALAAPAVAPLALEAASGGSRLFPAVTRITQDVRVVRHPNPSGPVAPRWEWAAAEAGRRRDRAYWVGYAFTGRPRKQGEVEVHDTDGFEMSEFSRTPLSRVLGETGGDVVVLFRVGRGGEVDRVSVRSTDVGMDLGGLPVYWLGGARAGESLDWLEARVAAERDPDFRGTLVEVVGLHTDSDRVVPYLARVLRTDGSASVRGEAAEELAGHPRLESLSALRRAVDQDGSENVRTEAVESLGELDMLEAETALLEIMRTPGREERVRHEALESLAERQSGMDLGALTSIALNDADPGIQREAVEQLAGFAPGSAAPLLRRIAWTHGRLAIRRQAAESLGELPARYAVAILDSIARRHPDAEVAKQAVESLGNYAENEVAPLLRRIARTHPQLSVRREAADVLANFAGDDADPDPDPDPDFDIDIDPGFNPNPNPQIDGGNPNPRVNGGNPNPSTGGIPIPGSMAGIPTPTGRTGG